MSAQGAAGEYEYTKYGFCELVMPHTISILQPDVMRAGVPQELPRRNLRHRGRSALLPVSGTLFDSEPTPDSGKPQITQLDSEQGGFGLVVSRHYLSFSGSGGPKAGQTRRSLEFSAT
ncbi:hypothetical protein B0H14DRAFT_3425412 [Mycena olivaceomarginata]|nr:hypothetical protein B0H14DRAFT_3425412 [Mycena olivaceomarginata]